MLLWESERVGATARDESRKMGRREIANVLGQARFDHGNVIECKFVCLTHSETNRTKMSEFGAKTGSQGQAKRIVAHAQKNLKSPWLSRRSFYRQNLE